MATSNFNVGDLSGDIASLSAQIGKINNPSRQSTSVLTYAASLSEGIHFYTTSGGTSDNPTSSGSYAFMIFRAATGITIYGMSLGSRYAYLNASNNSGSSYSGWQQLAVEGNFSLDYGNLTHVIEPNRADTATYSKSGGICTIHINNVSFSSGYSTDTEVFSSPYKPKYITRFLMRDNAQNTLVCYVSTAGGIYIAGYTASKLLYGSVSFVVA